MRKLLSTLLMGAAILVVWARPNLTRWTEEISAPQNALAVRDEGAPDRRPNNQEKSKIEPNSTSRTSEMRRIENTVLDSKVNSDIRRQSLHSLVAMGASASGPLLHVASSALPSAPPVTDRSTKFERSLRITALETLDELAVADASIARRLSLVANTQTDPMLQFLAQVSATGIAQGHPGKLHRMIDKMVR